MLNGTNTVPQAGPDDTGIGESDVGSCEAYASVAIRPLLRKVERMAQIGFWRLDLQSKHVFWSPEIFVIYDLPISDHVEIEARLDFFPEPDRTILKQAMARCADNGESYELALDFISAKGVHKRVRAMGEPEIVDGKTVALIGVFQDVSERHRLEQKLREAATTDLLTGLPNRRHLKLFYEGATLDNAEADIGSFALAIIDLDHFKAINDAHGHPAGDQGLREISGRLKESWLLRTFAARLGGDEFVLIMPDSDMADNPDELCRRLLASLGRPMQWQGKNVELSATIGLVRIEQRGTPMSEALACADAALYLAKANGRGKAAISSGGNMYLVSDQASPKHRPAQKCKPDHWPETG